LRHNSRRRKGCDWRAIDSLERPAAQDDRAEPAASKQAHHDDQASPVLNHGEP
jgi:hypothetical protein